jgi:hypothetical protein
MDIAAARALTVGGALAIVGAAMFAPPARSADLRAGPSSYREVVANLRPGDTLTLEAGVYRFGLDLHGISGTPSAPVAIAGTRGKARSVFVAQRGRNTISIKDVGHLRISDLDLVGGNAAVDAVKAEGSSKFAHHVTIERLRITGYARSQQNVGISTKCPTWDWTIRDNRISLVGTGMYLGDSDGSAPFVRGVIEGNVITGARGYALQVKHQNAWPERIAVIDAGETIIRYNTFAKDATSSSGKLARPNVLLGHWPLTGRGSGDRYLVYGNLFLDNPTEALFQAEGNVTLYNNVFVNRFGDGVALREHHDVPRSVQLFHNTILASGVGILLRHPDPTARQVVAGNAVFAGSVQLPDELLNANAVHGYADAEAYLRDPAALDLAPGLPLLAGNGAAPDDRLPDAGLDFDRKRRRAATAGAYEPGAAAAAAPFRY